MEKYIDDIVLESTNVQQKLIQIAKNSNKNLLHFSILIQQ